MGGEEVEDELKSKTGFTHDTSGGESGDAATAAAAHGWAVL